MKHNIDYRRIGTIGNYYGGLYVANNLLQILLDEIICNKQFGTNFHFSSKFFGEIFCCKQFGKNIFTFETKI